MDDQGAVRFERVGAIAHLTFDRPHARNAMTWAMYDQLHDAVQAIARTDGVRVAVLQGAGDRAFVAGTDIAQFRSFESGDDGVDYEERIERVLGLLEGLPVPTIAAVRGYAVGGGLTIAATCDLRICSPDARFGVPIARTLGNCLSMANYARLTWLLGPARTKALLMKADFMDAEEALAGGFVSEVVPAERLDARVAELADELARHAPLTMHVTKEALRRLMLSGLPDGEDLVRRVYGSEDFQRGVAAFVEKRSPKWQNC